MPLNEFYIGQCLRKKQKTKTKLKQKEFENNFSKECVCESECVPFSQCTQRDVTYGCSRPTSVGVSYAIIHTSPAIGETLAERERARCISVEFICPAVAEVKWFSKSCPFQHCSLKADLWLRLQFTPFSSLLHPASWTPGSICESWNVIHASSLHPCLPFLISSPFPTYLPVFPPPVPPIYRGDRVIRMWALVSYPINFFLIYLFYFFLSALPED